MSALLSPNPANAPEKLRPIPVPQQPKKPRQWFVLLGLLVILVGTAVALWKLRTPARPTQTGVAVAKTAKAFSGPLNIVLRMSGTTSARNFANITAPLLRGPESRDSLVLLDVARSGSLVRKGDIIAKIDAQPAQDHLDEVRDMVAGAENDVGKREAQQKVEWENMQQTLRVAKASLDKAKLDFSAGEVRTEVERQLLKLAMDEAEARYQQQLKDVDLRKVSQGADLKILGITLERQRRHLGRHLRDLQNFTIRSPIDGLIVMATVYRGGEMGQIQSGDQVRPGQQIMKVVDTRSMQVEGSVSQTDSDSLRLAQMAHIGFDAFPDLKFEGKINSIGALAVGGWRQNFYIRSVPVKVLIDGSDPRLIPDLSAHCDIVLKTVADQVQVPVSAIRTRNNAASVEVKRGDRFETREVQVGTASNTYVAILSGLRAGEEVRTN